MAIDDPYNLGPLKRIVNCNFELRIENGFADPDVLLAVHDGRFDQLYERDQGLINSDVLAGIGFNSANPTIFKAPGKYSGEMRKVIQALYSQGITSCYEYVASITHGIYTATNNSKWVIQISADGLIAVPMPKRSVIDPDHAWLGYTPTCDPDLFDAANPDLIILLTDIQVSDFFLKSSFFNACGWAFNSDGSALSNTAYTDTGGDYTGYMYTISISDNGLIPNLATFTLDESGRFRLPTTRGFKVPNSADSSIGTFVCDTGTAVNGDAPIYVFYDGALKKVMRAYAKEATATTYNDALPISGWTSYGLPFLSKLSQYNKVYNTQGTATVEESGCIVDGFAKKEVAIGASKKSYTYTSASKPGWLCVLGNNWFNFNYKLDLEYEVKATFNDIGSTFCIIPVGDREAIYQIVTENNTATSWNYEKAVNNARSTEQFVYHVPVTVGTESCRRGTLIYNSDPDAVFQATVYAIHPPAVVGTTICTYTFATLDNTNQIIDKSDTIEKYAELHLVASGGIQELIFYNSTMDESNVYTMEAYDQIMVSYPDSANTNLVCSAEMNGISGVQYYNFNVDTVKYPVTTITAGLDRFWVGDP